MSTLNVSNISDGTTTVATTFVTNGSAKAWHKYIQSSQTLKNSLNVSSITDFGSGQDRVSFVNDMSDDTYTFTGMNKDGGGINDDANVGCDSTFSVTASQYEYFCHHNGALNDSDGGAMLQVIGDLA